MQHNSKNGCSFCDQVGIRLQYKAVYQNRIGALRTDDSFLRREDPPHHKSNALSCLEKAGIKMISSFSKETMHGHDLGCIKTIFVLMCEDARLKKELPVFKESISGKLKKLGGWTTCDFPRVVSEFGAEYKRFKATQWHQLGLCTGIVALKDVISEYRYQHCLKFVVALRLLHTKDISDNMFTNAENLLKSFVETFHWFY